MFCRFLLIIFTATFLSFAPKALSANSFYEQAVQAFNDGNYEASYIYLKNALEQQPRNLPSKILMGKILLHKALFPQAIKEFEEALLYNADINLIIADYASALNFAKRYKDVLNIANGHRLSKTGKYNYLLAKAVAYQNLNLTELARKAYAEALTLSNNNLRALNSYASFELGQGNLDEAERLALEALGKTSQDHRTLHLLGQIEGFKNNWSKAIEYYQMALKQLSTDPVVKRSLVQAYIQTDQIDNAKNLVDEILTETPNDPHIMLMSSWLLSIDKQDKQSEQMLEALSNTTSLLEEEQYANDPSLIFVTAISSYLLGNMEQASKDLTRYLAVVPTDTKALSMLADIYIRDGNSQDAEILLSRYESSVLKDENLALKLVDLYRINGKRFDAERLLYKMQAQYPGNVDVTLKLVNILRKAGRVSEANKMLQEMNPTGTGNKTKLLLSKGLMSLQGGNVAEAEQIITKLLEEAPENKNLLNFKVAVLIKKKEAEAAQSLAERILESHPNFFEAKFNLATALKMQNKLGSALTLLVELNNTQPLNEDVKLMLAQTYYLQGNYASAIPILETISMQASGAKSKELLLDIFIAQNDYQQALRIIKHLTEMDLYNANYLFKYVNILTKLDRVSEAKYQLGILFGLAESNAPMLFQIARLQRGIKDYDAASKTLAKLKQLIPNNLRVRIEDARLVIALGQLDEGQRKADSLLKKLPKEANVLLLSGDIRMIRGQLNEAFDFYWQALEIDPQFNLALMNLYQLANRGKGIEKVTNKLKSLANEFESQLWRQRLLADHYMNQYQYELALPIYQELFQTPAFAKDPNLINNLANISVESDATKALEFSKLAMSINSANPAIVDTLGWVYFKLGRYDESLQTLRNAYAMDSSNPTIRYHLANTLFKLNRKSEAKRELKFAIENAENERWQTQAQELLATLD
ncbi:PEP-CTERM system TPR-repeat protein PrsT [Psychrosphaera sp.]|nr:PEP-CTERM system TPR-repeat protein PrsT [Psychrosphaera sp.]